MMSHREGALLQAFMIPGLSQFFHSGGEERERTTNTQNIFEKHKPLPSIKTQLHTLQPPTPQFGLLPSHSSYSSIHSTHSVTYRQNQSVFFFFGGSIIQHSVTATRLGVYVRLKNCLLIPLSNHVPYLNPKSNSLSKAI